MIANINWIFHEWDFIIWYTISFKYGLILLRYSLTDSVFISHYRKVVIFNIIVIQKKKIFFLVLKKIPNNCVFNSCCFLRIKRFLISLIAASFDSFFYFIQSKKISYIFNLVLILRTWNFYHCITAPKPYFPGPVIS